MEDKKQEIREAQRDSWNKFAPGWQKWDSFTMKFLKPLGDAMISSIYFKDTDKVLDIATGTGEPGLTIAETVVNGSVIGTDLSEEMLKVATQKATSKGLTNYTIRVADACELPFNDDEFDVVTCRLGYMFFPDVELAANEMHRVLKPGGAFATTVWGMPEDNPWVTSIVSAIKKHIEMPQPEPGSPGMFRCGEPNYMTDLLNKTGFQVNSNDIIEGGLEVSDSEEYWNMMTELAAPVVSAMSDADEVTIQNIRKEVFAIIDGNFGIGQKRIPFGARVITATK